MSSEDDCSQKPDGQDEGPPEEVVPGGPGPGMGARPKSLFGNAVWNIASIVWITLVALFITPFLIDNIGVSHYGFYMLLVTVSMMSPSFADATVRYVAHYRAAGDIEGINRVYGATFAAEFFVLARERLWEFMTVVRQALGGTAASASRTPG